MSAKGVIAAGDPQTAEAGAKLLREGANAVDAVVAAAFAAFVCELPLCSPLGGAVCVFERAGEAPVAFDMFARTPGLGLPAGTLPRDFAAAAVSFGAASQVFHVGRASVAVPLALSGLLELHRRWGSRPLRDVLAPAIALGRYGYVLGPGIAFVFDILRPINDRTDECRRLFLDDAGTLGTTGARLRNTDLASVLEELARNTDVVREIHEALAREMGPERGGLITAEDVAAAKMAEHTPIIVDHAGFRLATMPSPSTGGVLVALGLRLLEGVGRHAHLSREHVLSVARVQEDLLAERDETFVERCADPMLLKALLDDERLAAARERARSNLLGSTTHISVIDEGGTAVSLTLTTGEGSGHVLPGTGMIANNLLGEEDLHPRGFHRDAPGTPLATMMAPTIVSRGSDRIALGSGGSNRLRTAILQVLVGLLEHGLSPADAVHAPRLHLEIDPSTKAPRLALEAAGMAEEATNALLQRYPSTPAVFSAPNLYFGGVHLAMRRDGTFDAVGDSRRGGASVVV